MIFCVLRLVIRLILRVPRVISVGVVALAAWGVAILDGQESARPNLILHGARIYTVDSRQRVAEAVAISGERVLRVGSNEDVLALRGPSTRVLDLRGATIVPGFHDAHAHVVGLGGLLQDVDLRGTRSFEEVIARVGGQIIYEEP